MPIDMFRFAGMRRAYGRGPVMALEKWMDKARGGAVGSGLAKHGFAGQRRVCTHAEASLPEAPPRAEGFRSRPSPPASRGVCRPATKPAAARTTSHPAPIWLAALMASDCQAVANDRGHAIHWDCYSGRAFYTNCSLDTELIRPLGVQLQGGDTLAVSWVPGDTAYTLEVINSSTHYLA